VTAGYRIVELGPADIDRIMALERQAFDPSIQADAEVILYRFGLGHRMLGAEEDGRLVGTIGFSLIRFDRHDMTGFPPTFKAYSTQAVPPEPDTVCIYSLGVEPGSRVLQVAKLLVHSCFDEGFHGGLGQAIADGPLPSYAGNSQVKQRPEVRAMVDRYVATGQLPSHEEFLHDPVLALYRRLTECNFIALLPDFIADDEASGGWRVLLWGEFKGPYLPTG